MTGPAPRDHGGGLDAAIARYGGTRAGWVDLSTGINPVPYPVPPLPDLDWTRLPDSVAQARLIRAARRFWNVPPEAAVLAAPGASALIAQMPRLAPPGPVSIARPTYNEHAAAFRAAGREVVDGPAPSQVVVHPNNPDGRRWTEAELTGRFTIIDESFCDISPEASLVSRASRPDSILLKSFGKFWGLAGMRLGFAIGPPARIARLAEMLGPWPVAGPALTIGALALEDAGWAATTRARLAADTDRLDAVLGRAGLSVQGGTSLFRLATIADAGDLQDRLARAHIWTRIFPWSDRHIRFGLPGPQDWPRVEQALLT